jgi:hypothetical protein
MAFFRLVQNSEIEIVLLLQLMFKGLLSLDLLIYYKLLKHSLKCADFFSLIIYAELKFV